MGRDCTLRCRLNGVGVLGGRVCNEWGLDQVGNSFGLGLRVKMGGCIIHLHNIWGKDIAGEEGRPYIILEWTGCITAGIKHMTRMCLKEEYCRLSATSIIKFF